MRAAKRTCCLTALAYDFDALQDTGVEGMRKSRLLKRKQTISERCLRTAGKSIGPKSQTLNGASARARHFPLTCGLDQHARDRSTPTPALAPHREWLPAWNYFHAFSCFLFFRLS